MSTRGHGACIADERTPEPADVRGAVQRPVVDVFSFSPLAYRVQMGRLSRQVRLVRIAYKWTRCAGADRMLGLRRALCRLGVGTRSSPSQPGRLVTNWSSAARRLTLNRAHDVHSGAPVDPSNTPRSDKPHRLVRIRFSRLSEQRAPANPSPTGAQTRTDCCTPAGASTVVSPVQSTSREIGRDEKKAYFTGQENRGRERPSPPR